MLQQIGDITSPQRRRRGRGHDHQAPAALLGDADTIMQQRAYGTCVSEVQDPLRWGGVPRGTANNICCHNRHYAERAGSWLSSDFAAMSELPDGVDSVIFYDSVTGLPLFEAPKGRSWDAFWRESTAHGWPSFRDAEVIHSFVRVLPNGETVSVNGTHLGHNLPDVKGNRYCINLCSVAGQPVGPGALS